MGKYLSLSDCWDKYGSWDNYYKQFTDTVREFKVGETYTQHKGTWQESDWLVIYMYEDVALCVKTSGVSTGTKCLFYTKHLNVGFRYNDSRAAYRLVYKG